MRFVRQDGLLYGPVPTGVLDIDCGIPEGGLRDRILRKRGFTVCERHRLYAIDAADERLLKAAERIHRRSRIAVSSFAEIGMRKAFADVCCIAEEDPGLVPDANAMLLTLKTLGSRINLKYSCIATLEERPVGYMLVIRRHFRLRIATMQVLPGLRNRGIPLLFGAAAADWGLHHFEIGVIDERNTASIASAEAAGAVCKRTFCRYNRKINA